MPHSLDIIVPPLGGIILKPKIDRVEKKIEKEEKVEKKETIKKGKK